MSISNKIEISVIVPVYNESKTILDCIESLFNQTVTSQCEIILVDDGSTDGSRELLQSLPDRLSNKAKVRICYQKHSGPGLARNKGARKANGKVLVFVDADMTFEKNFIERLTAPILNRKTVGTDSQEEYLFNPQNFWAKCWNIGRFSAAGSKVLDKSLSVVPQKHKFGTIFRAIRKDLFEKAGGFELGGDYTDDESLSKKLNLKAKIVESAKFYHRNPDSVKEIVQRAWWIGSGKNFTGTVEKKMLNLIKFSLPVALIKGLWIGLVYRFPTFVIFKILYDTTVWLAVIASFGHSRF